MRYVLMIHANEERFEALSDSERRDLVDRYRRLRREAEADGVLVAALALRGMAAGVRVALRDDELLVTDGPFAETKEQLGGVFLLDVADLDAALAWAARVPAAEYGSVEVRPVWERADAPAG